VALLASAGVLATSVSANRLPGDVYNLRTTAPACTGAPVATHAIV